MSDSHDQSLVLTFRWRGTTRAEDALVTPAQSHISPSIPVYEKKSPQDNLRCSLFARQQSPA